MNNQSTDNQHLIKFIVASAFCFFVGTVHGVLQVIRPIRAWLDSIGSPYGGPGHMIDPLAHAHIKDHLIEARDLHRVGVAELLGQCVLQHLVIVLLEARDIRRLSHR